jgi:hypothetical protein
MGLLYRFVSSLLIYRPGEARRLCVSRPETFSYKYRRFIHDNLSVYAVIDADDIDKPQAWMISR